jgi:hypothetical protein
MVILIFFKIPPEKTININNVIFLINQLIGIKNVIECFNG